MYIIPGIAHCAISSHPSGFTFLDSYRLSRTVAASHNASMLLYRLYISFSFTIRCDANIEACSRSLETTDPSRLCTLATDPKLVDCHGRHGCNVPATGSSVVQSRLWLFRNISRVGSSKALYPGVSTSTSHTSSPDHSIILSPSRIQLVLRCGERHDQVFLSYTAPPYRFRLWL